MSEKSALLFYIPVANQQEAQNIATCLLKEGLIACANVFPSHVAIYEWQGKVQSDSENIMILKTHPSLGNQLETRIKELHSYDCPCIIRIASDKTNPEFFNWIEEQTIKKEV